MTYEKFSLEVKLPRGAGLGDFKSQRAVETHRRLASHRKREAHVDPASQACSGTHFKFASQ